MAERLPDAALDQLFHSARTRNGWADRAVDDATIAAIYDTAKWGPTSSNSSPARFTWLRSDAAKERLAACALGSNAAKIRAAPVTVIIGRDMNFVDRMDYLFPIRPEMAQMMRNVPGMREGTATRNTTLQGAYLMIAARAHGLDCGPMSGFDVKAVDAAFFADTDISTDFICAIGYGTEEGLFPRLPRLPFNDANRIL